MIRAIYLLLIVLLVMPNMAALASETVSHDSITVSATGHVDAEPDIVDLQFELFAIAPTLKQAKQQVDETYQNTLTAIKQFNIADQDIQLTRINSRAEYDWQKQQRVFKGQRVSRNLRLTIRQLAIYPEVLESLVNVGISEVTNINTRFSNRAQLEQAALANAVQRAKDKATFLATQFDRRLGQVEQISEGSAPVFRHHSLRQRSESRSVLAQADAVLPTAMFGTQKIMATVSVIYRLQ